MQDTAAVDLYNLLVTRDFEPEILDAQGKSVTDPSQAEMFSFDWKTADQNYGTVVALLGGDNNLEIYFGDNLGRGMEPEDRKEWYQFLEQMKQFASRNIMDFEINNLSRLKYTMQGMAAIKEGLFEGYYGTRKVSYSDQPKKTRLMIRHSRDLGEGDARHRNIDALFVETQDGNRFRLPFKKLIGGRAMARHISEGGTPYDAFGQHITEMMSEMDTMARFVRAAKHRGFTGEAGAMVESAIRHYSDLKSKAKRMISQRGYREERDAFRPDQFTDAAVTAEAIRDMFIEQTLDHRIEEALPVLARLAEQESAMMEADQFEAWAAGMVEGRDPNRLQDLMAKELMVGPDAANATEQLHGVLDDEELFDILRGVADQDPDANAWEDPAVQRRLAELGIEIPLKEPEIEATPMPEAARGRPKKHAADHRDDDLSRVGRIEKTATGLKHHARPERGGSEPESDPLDHLDRATTNRIEKALGIKWDRQKKYQGGIDTTKENFGGGGLQGAPIGGTEPMTIQEEPGRYEPIKVNGTPREGHIHDLSGGLNTSMLPGLDRLRLEPEDYSDTLYFRDPITKGVFAVYYHGRIPRLRGTDGMPEERVAEIVQSLATRPQREDLDTDGVMMNKPSNMSSESIQRLKQLAKI